VLATGSRFLEDARAAEVVRADVVADLVTLASIVTRVPVPARL
jgi:hypothetical protein